MVTSVSAEREAAENEILSDLYAQAGRLGGGIGGAIGGGAGAGGARGGARGARRAAKWLKNEVCEVEFELPMSEDASLAAVERVLEEEGQGIEPLVPREGVLTRSAVVGSIRRNWAVVTIELRGETTQSTRVQLRAVSKEGLIKQHAATKTADRLRDALTAL
jgi:hypothetical protein